jgi:hypothetical protein
MKAERMLALWTMRNNRPTTLNGIKSETRNRSLEKGRQINCMIRGDNDAKIKRIADNPLGSNPGLKWGITRQ